MAPVYGGGTWLFVTPKYLHVDQLLNCVRRKRHKPAAHTHTHTHTHTWLPCVLSQIHVVHCYCSCCCAALLIFHILQNRLQYKFNFILAYVSYSFINSYFVFLVTINNFTAFWHIFFRTANYLFLFSSYLQTFYPEIPKSLIFFVL